MHEGYLLTTKDHVIRAKIRNSSNQYQYSAGWPSGDLRRPFTHLKIHQFDFLSSVCVKGSRRHAKSAILYVCKEDNQTIFNHTYELCKVLKLIITCFTTFIAITNSRFQMFGKDLRGKLRYISDMLITSFQRHIGVALAHRQYHI